MKEAPRLLQALVRAMVASVDRSLLTHGTRRRSNTACSGGGCSPSLHRSTFASASCTSSRPGTASAAATFSSCRTSRWSRSSTAPPNPTRWVALAVGLVTPRVSGAPRLRAQVFSTKQFIEKTADERAAILRTFSDAQIEDVETAIKAMPHFDIEYQAFVKVPHKRLARVGLAQLAHFAALPLQGDDDDVATQLFDMCMAEEKRMKGEVEEDEVDSDEENLYIPEDEEDDGPCAAPSRPRPAPRPFAHAVRAATTCRGSPPRG